MDRMRSAPPLLLIGIALGAAGPAAAEPPVAALVPVDGGAAFEPQGSSPGQVLARGDGATLVACGAALVSAADGSRASIACGGETRVELSNGAFRVAVGSKGAVIRVGAAELRAVNARLWAVRAGETWLVRFEGDGEQGAVEVDGAALAPDAMHVLHDAASADGPADAGSVAASRDAIARLSPREGARRALVPRRVESADDFKAGATASAEGGGEIELEAIEVEAGCIEVCVD